MKLNFILILASVLILTNCNLYPLYNFEVTTLEDEKWYYKGREIISNENNGVQVIISFEDQFGNDLIFNFSIINSTNQIIELDPTKMFLQIEKTYPQDYYENEIVIYSPIDPEKQINKLRKQLRNTTVSKLNTYAAYVFVSLAELVKDFSDLDNGKTSDEQYQNYLINEQRNQSFNLQNINYQNAIRNLSDTKYYWENYALRKTTLYPRDVISGFVHFPLDERARDKFCYQN